MIYLITTLKIESGIVSRNRSAGYTTDYKKAVKIANLNIGDLHESGYYNYIVIESIEEGLYNYDDNPKWFVWDSNKKGFFECEKPKIPEYSYYGGIG